MRTWTLSPFTRQAAEAVSRRASLATLGGASLAAVRPDISAAENKKKKSGSDCKKKEKQRCANEAATCKPSVLANCELEPVQCLAVAACCDECSANGYWTCVLAAFE
jgi:hypothetical protein